MTKVVVTAKICFLLSEVLVIKSNEASSHQVSSRQPVLCWLLQIRITTKGAKIKVYSKEEKDEGNKMQHTGKSRGQSQDDDPSLGQDTSFQYFSSEAN
jgi:hypothetical protein